MSINRRKFVTMGVKSALGLMVGSSFTGLPSYAMSSDSNASSKSRVITVSFMGTACTRDEGEATRAESDKRIYLPESGYIPARINLELGGNTQPSGSSDVGQTVRGVGENDWATPRNNSETLKVSGPLNASDSLLKDIRRYISGNQLSTAEQIAGYSMPALALHGANIAADSGAGTINLIGHSRGAAECIMAAWFLFAYGSEAIRNTPVNIFAIDPVPGTGEWYSILTQLPPNVVNYVGVYAWDHIDGVDHSGHPFQALVPRPNGRMRGESNDITIHQPSWWDFVKGDHDWKVMANEAQQRDPLLPSNHAQPIGYSLYSCRGRHSTVSGNSTADGQYDHNNLSSSVAPVPGLIYKMARGYLTKWGTTFVEPCAVTESVLVLRKNIHMYHQDFDTMGGGQTRNSLIRDRPYVRRVSSIYGINPLNTYFMDDVVGDPPYKLAFPVTKHRKNKGWVDWKFL
ncbi:Tat pathway signal protein [Grimontia sp. NTOU-MAR1]|uniref:Tat pathway signal protein n=1 Tax=Grimontia sp. NTOU-MAR1 TaxID=3111011 RepID=UPI002DBD923D|nr:Tat pathway signal protein [Grimontia sp. NTOU-MAR1]WRV99751.1 Tat pathway signal protein [Grimontia sp. NTOU-MAR1]